MSSRESKAKNFHFQLSQSLQILSNITEILAFINLQKMLVMSFNGIIKISFIFYRPEMI